MTDTASSKIDLLLHKSEPISQAGGVPVKTYLRVKTTAQSKHHPEKGLRKM